MQDALIEAVSLQLQHELTMIWTPFFANIHRPAEITHQSCQLMQGCDAFIAKL